MCRLWIAAAVPALFLASAPPCLAARAEVAVEWDKYGARSILYVTAAAGERNEIVVTRVADRLRVRDATPVTAGGSCEPQPDGSVVCFGSAQAFLSRLHVDAGDLDDSVGTEAGRPTYLEGGAGNDELTVGTQPGIEPGAVFEGGPGDDRMVGAGGHDVFHEGAVANGSDVIEADASDSVVYTQRTGPVRVDLDAEADDGEPGERDRVGREAGTVLTGAGEDTLVGNELPNVFDAGQGRDTLFGRAGDDWLSGGGRPSARDAFDEHIHGGPGRDQLRSGGGDDRLTGGRGPDLLESSRGRDLLIPGPGVDRALAGPGNDIVRARDRNIDQIDCGRGWDRLSNDRLDWQLRPGCERHERLKA
jgi:hypothetical protein